MRNNCAAWSGRFALGIIFIGADVLLYLTVKSLRGDFWYWMPLEGNLEILCSALSRVIIKIITDFTSLVHMRHPYELGGIYWTFGFVMSMGSFPAAIKIYERREGQDHVVDLAWRLLYILIPTTLVMFTVFFLNVDEAFRKTFVTLQTGRDFTIRSFKESDDDFSKADKAFRINKRYSKSIEKEIRAWVQASWNRWEAEQPEWLDDAMRAKIPADYIPKGEESRMQREVTTSNSPSSPSPGNARGVKNVARVVPEEEGKQKDGN